MIFSRIIEFLSGFIPYPDLNKEQVFVEWKNRLLLILLGAFVVIGPFAFIPGTIVAVLEKIWGLVISNTIIYSVLLFISLSKKINSNHKVLASITMFYLLSITVFLEIGPRGSGFNWMFIFVLLSTFFYGSRGGIISLLVSFGTLLLLLVPIIYEFPFATGITEFGVGVWLTNVAIFMAVSLLISLSLNEVLVNIDQSLEKEKQAALVLKESQLKLEEQRNRAEESDKLKSQFLANMSHEIRTPMNTLIGFSSLVTESNLDEQTKKHYKGIISHSGEQLVHIIDDIIDIAKIESNQIQLNIGAMNVNDALIEIAEINMNRIEIMKKAIQIRLKFPESSKKIAIKTDMIRFKQILNNLVVNAVKYTDEGIVEIGYDIVNEGTGFLKFYVKDSGKGIPQKLQQDIFKRFTQVSNDNYQEGTGLGLSIVKGLLDLLDGEIWVDSDENVGSTFYFKLPGPDMYPNEEFKKPKKTSNIPDFEGKTIFVAEDDEHSYFFIQHALRKTNVEIRRAIHGEQLLSMLASELPDLVLLDINMPVLNGFETMDKLRNLYPELPVVAQTAYAMADDRQKCFDCGCNEYLSKPIKPMNLYKVLQLFLN